MAGSADRGRIVSGVRFKFCGIRRIEDAEFAAELGAWAIGINLWRGSSRYCDLDTAAAISAAVRRRVEVAGVFVNPTLDEVAEAAMNIPLSIVQLHGDEGPAFCREVARRTGCRVIKALHVQSSADVQAAEAYRVDFHLLDTFVPGMQGGTGESFDWEIAAARRSEVPVILAGGLTPENVGEAIAVVRPDIVDVAGGIESAPGVKDPILMQAFAEQVRLASPQPTLELELEAEEDVDANAEAEDGETEDAEVEDQDAEVDALPGASPDFDSEPETEAEPETETEPDGVAATDDPGSSPVATA